MNTDNLLTLKGKLSSLLDNYPIIHQHRFYINDETKNYMFKIKIKIVSKKNSKFLDTIVIEGQIDSDIDKLLANIDEAIREKINVNSDVKSELVCCNY